MAGEKTRLQEHAEAMKAKKAALALLEEKKRRAEERFRASANELLKIPAGVDFLVGLFHLCGYNLADAVTGGENGDLLEGATEYNGARRSVYVDVRKRMDPDMRAKMELLAETTNFDDKKPK